MSNMMDQLGTDFHATGSVMTPAQLQEYRLKRGECVTCGRKCFHKKLFKMIPITDHGRVLKGRCLNCNPLDSSDASKQADGGVIPAVSRRATREDLARFNKSQSNLATRGANGATPASMPPGPLQRTVAASVSASARSSSSTGSGSVAPRRASTNVARSSSTDASSMQAMASHVPPRQPFTRGLSQRSNTSTGSAENNNPRSSDQQVVGGNSINSNSTGSGSGAVPRRMRPQKRASYSGPLTQPMHGNSSIRSVSRESLVSDGSANSHNGRDRTNVSSGHAIEEESSMHQDISEHHDDDEYIHSPVGERDQNRRMVEGHLSDQNRSDHHRRSESPETSLSSSAHAIMNRRGSGHYYRSPQREASEADDTNGSFGDDEYVDEIGHIPNESGHRSMESRTRSHHSRENRSMGSRSRHAQVDREMDKDCDNESFTNASENYDDYAPLPDFAAGVINPTGDEIQDALERITGANPYDTEPHDGAHMDQHHLHDHPSGAEDADGGYAYDRRQSERSLGSSSYQNNHSRGRESSSTRSLRSDRSGHNTEDEIAAYDAHHLPKHGILNRGGAVNLVHMTGGGAQQPAPEQTAPPRDRHASGRLLSSSDHGPSSNANHQHDEIPYGSGHVVTPGRGDVYGHSNRSLDSVSSFGDEGDGLPFSTVERQESMSSFPSQARGSRGGRQNSVDQQLGASSHHSRRQHGAPHHNENNMNISGHSLTLGAATRSGDRSNADSYHTAGGSFMDSCGTYMTSGYGARQDSQITATESTDEGMHRLNLAGDDFIQIIQIIRDYPHSEPVLSNSMQEISNLHLSPEDCDVFTDEGGIEAIMEAMRRFPEEAELQLCACRALCNVSGTQENQMALVDMGASDILLDSIMEHFADIPELQEQAMAALANLAALEANLEHLIEKEVVSRVVQAMNKHGSDIQVQMKGCSVITNLASHPSPMKASVMMAGGGGAVVLSMVLHSKDPQLQEKGLQALRNLSANCEENKVELAHIGGIDASITAMQVHRDNPYIQEAGAWTLCNLAGNMNNKQQIGESGGIDVVVRAMWVHSDQMSVHEWCARALFSLSLHPSNCRSIIEVGGISAVVNAMQAHEKSSVLQEMGCAILCNLANEEAAKLRIVDEEALDAIVLAMVLFGEDAKVQERACQVLLQLAIAQNVTAMHASNVVELVRAASGRFPDNCGEPADQLISMLEEFSAGYNSGRGGIPVGGTS